MEAMLSAGMEWLDGLELIGAWFTAPIGSLASLMGGFADYFIDVAGQVGLGDVVRNILYHTNFPYLGSVGGLMIGAGMTAVLGFRLVKFVTDIVL